MSYLKSNLKLKITVFLIITALIFWLIPSNLIFAEEGQSSEEEIVTEETSDSSEESIEEEATEEVTEEETAEEEVTEEEVTEEETAEEEVTEEEVTEEETSEEETAEGEVTEEEVTEEEVTEEEVTEEEVTEEEVTEEETAEEELTGEEAVTDIIEVEEAVVSTLTLSTDKPDYMPEDTVLVSGSGYEAGETILIRIVKPNGSIEEDFLVVNSDGSVSYSYNLVNGMMATYLVQVIDPETNEALSQCSFTDYDGPLYVDPSGGGDPAYCFTTIQAAIDAANKDATIIVMPGTYSGNLLVYKEGLKIQSMNGAADTIIDANLVDKSNYTNEWGKGINYSWAETDKPGLLKNGFDIWSDYVTIDGFTINNAAFPAGYNQGIGILVGSIDTTYAGFVPWNVDQWGGLISPVDKPTPTGVTLKNNVIDGASDGIYIWASSGNTIEYNEIKNITPLGGVGIQVYGGGTDNIIQYNTIKNAVDGISICGTWPNNLLDVSNTQVIGNTITDCTVGIKFYNIAGTNVIAKENDIQNNSIGIKVESVGDATVASAQFNNLVGNTTGVQNSAALGIFNASQNWWGSATGPNNATTNPSGTGNAVSDNVDYSPWWGADYVGVAFPWTWYLNNSNGSTIQEGINAASAGDTVNVTAGTYNESVNINKNNLTLMGDFNSKPEITGGLKLDTDLTGLELSNFLVKGSASSATTENSIVRMYGVIKDLIVDNCIFDGENILDRLGFSGSQTEGNLTVTNSEFKNILGWAVFDTRSGSGGDGSAMDTVIFSNNNVHDCNGSVVFRGLSTDRTDKVDIYGNTFQNIGGNQSLQGEQWAAFEVNHSILANIYDNIIKNVSKGLWDEGQAMQLWDIDILDVHNNTITDNYQGIYIFRGEAGGAYGGPYAIPGGSIYENLISGNTQYGISVQSATTGGLLNAVNNWWGSKSGPYNAALNNTGTGDKVSDNVNFNPWLIGSKQKTTNPGDNIVNAKSDVGVDVEVTGTGTPTVTVAKYSENPGSGFANGLGLYTDLHIDDATGVTKIVYRMYYTDADVAAAGVVETSLKARFWDGSNWIVCTKQTVNTVDNYIEVTIDWTTAPSLGDLVGTAFGVSGTPPVTPTPAVTTVAPVSAPKKTVGVSTPTSTGIEVLGIQELPFTGVNPLIPISGISTILAGGLMVVISTIRKRFGKK